MAAPAKPMGNPAFKYLGLPTIRAKLPSRNWLIFLSISSTFAGIIYHDRREQSRIQRLWASRVAHLSQQPLSPLALPRKLTVFLSAAPGTGTDLRSAQEHYRDFVKPVFVAAALDVEFVEARRMGEVRARAAERARVARGGGGVQEDAVVEETRRKAGVKRVPGVQGDVVLGRHTWKEYVQGVHEGWLGPLEAPPDDTATVATPTDFSAQQEDTAPPDPPIVEDVKPVKPAVTPPYILPLAYASAPLPAVLPDALDPVGFITFPHILGFLNTPVRLYRFVTRRHLADVCGREAAAIALAWSRPLGAREVEEALRGEEGDWPARYWSDETLKGVWQEDVVVDERIVARMKRFVDEGEAESGGGE
ncbi:hypothetical protein Q9L58_001028 [Maublancomyces gigas]|uniref:Mitochondrial import inner membrane translocase subunit TIM54 n=1 Tax=Discina gigas TaxID=1032678 RepID=A0ABR3GVG4_9PEZI